MKGVDMWISALVGTATFVGLELIRSGNNGSK